jgi:hypothetical protein
VGGKWRTRDLERGGASTLVTDANKARFVELRWRDALLDRPGFQDALGPLLAGAAPLPDPHCNGMPLTSSVNRLVLGSWLASNEVVPLALGPCGDCLVVIVLVMPTAGLYEVVPHALLVVFDASELELMLCGVPDIDVEDWKRHTTYAGGCEDKCTALYGGDV